LASPRTESDRLRNYAAVGIVALLAAAGCGEKGVRGQQYQGDPSKTNSESAAGAKLAPTAEKPSWQPKGALRERWKLAIRWESGRWMQLVAREQVLDLGRGCKVDADCHLFHFRYRCQVEIAQSQLAEFRSRTEGLVSGVPPLMRRALEWEDGGTGRCLASGSCAVHPVPAQYSTRASVYTDAVFRGERPLRLSKPVVWPFPSSAWGEREQTILERSVRTCAYDTFQSVLAEVQQVPGFRATGSPREFHLGGDRGIYLSSEAFPRVIHKLQPLLTLFEEHCGRPPDEWPCWADDGECPPMNFSQVTECAPGGSGWAPEQDLLDVVGWGPAP
jgi:hypothetical protein